MSVGTTKPARKLRPRTIVLIAAIAAVLVAMFFGTKVVSGEEAAADSGRFDPAAYADEKWDSEILPELLDRATPLIPLTEQIAADPAAAATEHGAVEGSSAPVYTVTFTGVAGAVEGGLMEVTVDGLPAGQVRVQMGPAINGMAIRDGSGLVHFPQFTNQIDYQDAGTALNEKVKTTVLAEVDAASLEGKTVTMTGVFQYVNPASFLVTPITIAVD